MFAPREGSRVAKSEAAMGLRLMCLVIAGCLLGCGGARTTNAGTAPATQVRSPEEQQALLAYHLGLLAQRIDTHCPEHALDAVLNAGAAPTLPPCDVNMDVEDVALLGWLELLSPGPTDLEAQLRALGEPQVLPSAVGCDAPDPQELIASLHLAVALQQRLREEADTDSVGALTLRALIRQQLATALDRKWTAGDVDAVDRARPLIPSTSRASSAAQIMAMFGRVQVEPDDTCFVEDESAAPWAHREDWIRGQLFDTPATITGPRILFQPALFNYDGVLFAVLSSRQSIDATLAALESAGATRIPWPDEAPPRLGATLLRHDAGSAVNLQVVLPGPTEHMIVFATIGEFGGPSDSRLQDVTASLATLTRDVAQDIFDAPVAIDDPAFIWRSSATLFAPNWTWSQEQISFSPTRPMIAVVVTPATYNPCTQNAEVPPTPVVRFGLSGCEMVGGQRGLISVTTILTYGTQLLSISALHPDAPGVTEASVLVWAHGVLDRARLLRMP